MRKAPITSNKKSKRGLEKSKVRETKASKPTVQQCGDDTTTYYCLVCGETYEEAWIQCEKCKLWAHEACADLSHSKYYFCDNCNAGSWRNNHIMDWAYKTHQLLYKGLLLIFQTMFNYTLGQETVRGHPFMTSTKNHVFDPLPCPHASTWAGPPPPCGRPHTVDMKYTPLSW